MSMIDKNSAPNKSHKTADRKNEKTKLIADKTGFEDVITFIDVKISNELKMMKVMSSIFIIYFFLYLLILLSHTYRLF